MMVFDLAGQKERLKVMESDWVHPKVPWTMKVFDWVDRKVHWK